VPDSQKEPTVSFREMLLIHNAYQDGRADGHEEMREAAAREVARTNGHPWVEAWKQLMRPFPYPWTKT